MEASSIDDLFALLCDCNLLENANNEEIHDEIMECVNADTNEFEVIEQASNTNVLFSFDENE